MDKKLTGLVTMIFILGMALPALGQLVRPVHQYTFEDGTANDYIGFAHGTLVGGAVITDGALVTFLQDQWMDMPGDVIAMNTYSEVSIEAWFTATPGLSTGWSFLAYFGGQNPSLAWMGVDYFFITTTRGPDRSRAAISVGDNSTPWEDESGVDGPECDDGLLHHMVSTIDSNEIAFYIDGVLIGSTPLVGDNHIEGISQQLAYLAKGGYDYDPEWIGAIEEFNIYNFALSAAQVAVNYAAGPVPVPGDLGGSIVGWGAGGPGQSGYGHYGQATPPTGNDFVAIAAGNYHSLALKQDGSIVGWGAGEPGKSGWPHYGQAITPAGSNYVAIAGGGHHSLAIREPCPYVLTGDVNDDCTFDFYDFAKMAESWLIDCYQTPEDPACIPK